MTTAVFSKTRHMHSAVISGHADFAKPDTVCAAASMLGCLLIEMLKNEKHFSFFTSGAYIELKAERAPRTDIIVETIKRGFEMLSKRYPENVRVISGGCTWKD